MSVVVDQLPPGEGVHLDTVHPAPLGSVKARWTPAGLYRVQWTRDVIDAENRLPNSCPTEIVHRAERFSEALAAYFSGDFSRLDAIGIDRRGWTPFFSTVYRICRNIPAGQTLSYGELAQRAGSPRAARAVGQAMASNRLPLVIPCHRVLASGGKMGGYSGPGGTNTKRWLLALERGSFGEPVEATSALPGSQCLTHVG
jgi:methylated-DNA-[protein]-cysteine S-methyltransferase